MKKTKSFCDKNLISNVENYIKNGNLENMKLMLITKKINREYKDKRGNSLLHLGIFAKQYNICRYLVENEICNINEENIWNMTPLEQAIHLKTYTNDEELTKIICLLQENKAYYKFNVDSEQIIYGKRTEYYQKLKFILKNLSFLFQNYKVIQFYHNTYNTHYLFPFSESICNSPSFMKYTSNLIFENNYHLFKSKHFSLKHFKNQNELFIYPFCKLHNIEYIYNIPLKIDGILLGYFVVWTTNEEPFSKLNFESIFSNIINEDYFEILSISPKIYNLNINHILIVDYIKKITKILKDRIINPYYLKLTLIFLNKIQNFNLEFDPTYQYLMKIAQFYKKILIPFGNIKTLYQLVHSISFKENFNEKSYPLLKLYDYQLDLSHNINYSYNHLDGKKKLSSFDFYSILGYSINKEKQEKLNYILNNTTDFFNFNIYSIINSILTENKDIRNSNVFGSGSKPLMFIFPEEIKNALDYVFSSSYPLFYKYFYIYICITQYIHPFKDGNGRTSRMILSFCIYKVNEKIISRNDKLLSLTDYISLFN